MNKESLNNQTQTRKTKGLGVLALLGVCVVAVATFMGTWESPQAIHEEAALAHMEYLIKHHQWLEEQDQLLGGLIEEGVENQIAIAGALAVIGKAQTFAKVAGPIVQGVGKIWKNIVWGSGVAVKTVDVKKIDAAFNDSKVFVAEIKKRFPKSHAMISKLRQDLKVYQFDLSNIVDDLKLMADSTSRDVDKSTRTLKLRKKILDGDRMQPEKDKKIWNQTIKMQTNNLTASIEKCDAIIEALEKLQKAVAVCRDELQNEIDTLRKLLEASNKELKRKLVDLEKKMKSIGCVNNGKELLRAIFTLGLACLFDNDTKKEMLNVKADLREEQAIIQAISKRMNYFDDLLGSADTLVKESAEVLKTTKTFRQALVQAKTILERDYTEEEVEENLGDVDFANDFAMELYKVLHKLKLAAEHVSNDCKKRKHRLDDALSGIDKYFGDGKKEELEEIVELALVTDAQFGAEFNKISDRCSGYFEDVSVMIDKVQNGFLVKVINGIMSMKNVLLLEDKDSFTNLKLKLFEVLDAARDVQLKIESAQYRLAGNPKKINRYISKKAVWYYQHKYSTRTGQNCEEDKITVATHMAVLKKSYEEFHKVMLKAVLESTWKKLDHKHSELVKKIKELIAAERKEPSEPKYTRCTKPLVGADEDDEEKYEACKDSNKALLRAYTKKHNAWRAHETARRQRLASAKIDKKTVDKRIHTFKAGRGKINTATKHRDDKMVTFPTGLDKEIAAYKAGLTLGRAQMTADEQKAAIARNLASQKLAEKNHAATEARGKTNQKVKQSLIW